MCGRYTLTSPHDAVAEHFETEVAPKLPARYNLAPTQESVIITASPDRGRAAEPASWGFELSRGGKRRLVINARSESVANRPAFRESYHSRRCLVPANGFYEWAKIGRTRQPFYFTSRKLPLFAFAGLWELDEAAERLTYVILTTAANEEVARVHDRMPVLLGPDRHDVWLDPESASESVPPSFFEPWPTDDIRSQAVGLRVNDVACDEPGCVQPIRGAVDLFVN